MTPMKTPIILTKPTADRVIIIILFCAVSLVTTGFEDTRKKLSTESTTCFELVYLVYLPPCTYIYNVVS